MIDVIGSHLLMFIVLKPPKPKRLDMEPPEVPFGTNLPSTFSTLRIRGGMEHEPVDKYGTTVPKLSSSNFMWDGQPSVTLMKDIIYPLYIWDLDQSKIEVQVCMRLSNKLTKVVS